MKSSYKKLSFSNGITAILQPMLSIESVTVSIAVGAGPRYETEETAGLAHFLEHMLFEGTKRLPTSKDVAEYIEKIGGKSSAFTDKEFVSYGVKVPKEYLNTAFDYLSDILFNSLLVEKAIEKEKGIVLEELSRSKDNPEVDIWDLWLEWIWGKEQSLGRSTLGNEVAIKNITKGKLQSYLSKFYNPSNMAIAVAGNFSPKEAEKYIFQYFGKIKNKKIPVLKTINLQHKDIHTKIVKSDIMQAKVILGFITDISYHHKDRFTMRVIASILSGGVSSRLFHKLVYELGIAYSAWAQMWTFTDTGLFYISGGFSPQNIEKAIKVIMHELEKLKKEKITEKELHEAKEKDKTGLYFSLETSDSISNLYSSQLITEKQIMTPEEISRRIDAVTAEDIQRAAIQYFITKNLYLTVKGPLDEKDDKKLEKLLK